MPCGPTCVAHDEPGVECLAVLYPETFACLKGWCASDDPVLRRSSLDRSRRGYREPTPYAGPPIRVEIATGPVPFSPIGESSVFQKSAPPPGRIPLAENLKALAAVKACPHLGGWVNGCSCTGRRHCAIGKGSVAGQPTRQECYACVQESPTS